MNAISGEWMFEYHISSTIYFDDGTQHDVAFFLATRDRLPANEEGGARIRNEITMRCVERGDGIPVNVAIRALSLLSAPPESEQVQDAVLEGMRQQRRRAIERLLNIINMDESDTSKVLGIREFISQWGTKVTDK